MNLQIKNALVLMLLLAMVSCKTSNTISTVERVSIDTVYINNYLFDSVYVERTLQTEYRKASVPPELKICNYVVDTVYMYEREVEHHFRSVEDSTYITHSDTIPEVVILPEPNTLTTKKGNKMTLFENICYIALILMVLFVMIRSMDN